MYKSINNVVMSAPLWTEFYSKFTNKFFSSRVMVIRWPRSWSMNHSSIRDCMVMENMCFSCGCRLHAVVRRTMMENCFLNPFIHLHYPCRFFSSTMNNV